MVGGRTTFIFSLVVLFCLVFSFQLKQHKTIDNKWNLHLHCRPDRPFLPNPPLRLPPRWFSRSVSTRLLSAMLLAPRNMLAFVLGEPCNSHFITIIFFLDVSVPVRYDSLPLWIYLSLCAPVGLLRNRPTIIGLLNAVRLLSETGEESVSSLCLMFHSKVSQDFVASFTSFDPDYL